jgi:hypothetical protein
MDELCEYSLRDLNGGDMVGISIRNEDNHQDRPIGPSFRRRDLISRDLLWNMFERATQANARFNALATLTFAVDSVRMAVGFGDRVLRSRGRPLSVMANLKRSIAKVVTEENCLAHALVFAVVTLANDPDCKAAHGRNYILPKVRQLDVMDVELSNGGGIPELTAFRRRFS